MMKKINQVSLLCVASVALILSGCGSDSTGTGGIGGVGTGTTGTTTETGTTTTGTGTTTTGSSVNDARTIVLSYPITDSIENLGGGVYRRFGKAIVTDNEGNPVPDGTKVYFNIIDSIMAKGTITTADSDSIVNSVLTDTNPTLADGTVTTLDSAYVIRNEAFHFIRGGDHVFLKSDSANGSYDANSSPNSEPEDKNRIISSDDGSITANTVTVTQDYSVDYPSANYTTGVTDYLIGSSLLGAEVQGVDGETGEVENIGYSTTKDGVAEFFVTYPANVREINTGCVQSTIDARSLPLGSADVVLVASAGTEAITVDDRFCMEPIVPFTVVNDFNPVINAGAAATDWLIPVEIMDANKVRIPYERVDLASTTSSQLVHINSVALTDSLGNPTSNSSRYGWIYVALNIDADATATSSDTATIVVSSGEGSAEISVSVLEDPSGAIVSALTASPSDPVIVKTAAAGPKTSGVMLALADSGGNASKTVYARVVDTANTGGLTVTLDGAYDAALDLYSYTTDADGVFTSLVTVANGAASDAATITYFYGVLEVEAKVNILP